MAKNQKLHSPKGTKITFSYSVSQNGGCLKSQGREIKEHQNNSFKKKQDFHHQPIQKRWTKALLTCGYSGWVKFAFGSQDVFRSCCPAFSFGALEGSHSFDRLGVFAKARRNNEGSNEGRLWGKKRLSSLSRTQIIPRSVLVTEHPWYSHHHNRTV